MRTFEFYRLVLLSDIYTPSSSIQDWMPCVPVLEVISLFSRWIDDNLSIGSTKLEAQNNNNAGSGCCRVLCTARKLLSLSELVCRNDSFSWGGFAFCPFSPCRRCRRASGEAKGVSGRTEVCLMLWGHRDLPWLAWRGDTASQTRIRFEQRT